MRAGQARRRDANESAVVDALRKVGVAVKPISDKGIADLLCYHSATGYFLLEVKSRTGTLTAAQYETRHSFPFHLARTEAEALDLFFRLSRRPQ